MADIRNDQYLHRPGAGRGSITPADPLETRLFDGSGNPIAPATETTLAVAVTRLESILSRLEGVFDISDRSNRALGQVQLTGSLGSDGNVYSRGGTLAASSSQQLFEITQPCVIDLMTFSANTPSSSVRLKLEIRQADSTWVPVPQVQIGTSPQITGEYFTAMNDSGSILFELVRFDNGSNSYIAQLKRPLSCPHGARLTVSNNSQDTASNVAVGAVVRTFDS